MLSTGFLEFKVDYSGNHNLAIGGSVLSKNISAGGYLWRIHCYPRGVISVSGAQGPYLSMFLSLLSNSKNVKAFFDVFVLNRDGQPNSTVAKRCLHVFEHRLLHGWDDFMMRNYLESTCLPNNGFVTFMCSVIVVSDKPTAVPMPPPDIGIHLGRLLDSAIGTDVAFLVDGEQFHAHRAVLAARSPVFQAELFGSMAEATMPSITVQEIKPGAFKLMLRFMYTDSFPEDNELGGSPTDMLQHLLAAADRFAMDRLKVICSLKLINHVSVDTVGSILVCAGTYNCPELKNKCLDFFAVQKNFNKAVFTDGFAILLQKFPSIAAELRNRVNMKK